MKGLISVILPVYNGAQFLSDAIESILTQDFNNFEFIIINDGSTDDSIKIIEHYASVDSRIIAINRENKGLIYTLNEGIKRSTGEYIARMDADDVSIKNRLQSQYKYMSANKLDICGGNYIEIDADSKETCHKRVFQKDYEILLAMATNVPFAHPSVMMRKEFLNLNKLTYGMNGYKHAEDLDLWMNMYNSGAKFGNINSFILKYRVLSTSLSRVNIKKIKNESNIQFNKFVKKNKNNFEKAFKYFFENEFNNQELEKIYILAVLQYSLVSSNFNMLYYCIKKVSGYRFFIASLSFIKLKYGGLRLNDNS